MPRKVTAVLTALISLAALCAACTIEDVDALRKKAEGKVRPPNSYVVSFIVNGGTGAPDDMFVADGGLIDRPDNPVRGGYSFEGWYKAGLIDRWDFSKDTVTKDETLSGKWSGPLAGAYTVRFMRNGGVPFPEDAAVDSGAALNAPAVSKTGCAFGGWFKDPACAEDPWLFNDGAVTSDVTLYAKWNEPNRYTVNFIANGGTPVPQQVAAFAGAAGAVTTARPGYAFDGWYEESGPADKWDFVTHKVQGNLNLYAKWAGNTLTIAYESGGGAGSAPESPASAAYGTNVTMPANTYTCAGYIFGGWEVTGEGSVAGTYAAGAAVPVAGLSTAVANGNAAVTLRATWTDIPYSIDSLREYLAILPANTAAAPYTVKLNVGDITGIADALTGAANKYVYLDLSGSTITTVPDSAFSDCTRLTGVTIPDGVTAIGSEAFRGYTGLASVTFAGTIPSSTFNQSAFGTSGYSGYIGDLRAKFYAAPNTANGTPGTYTRASGNTWTKQ